MKSFFRSLCNFRVKRDGRTVTLKAGSDRRIVSHVNMRVSCVLLIPRRWAKGNSGTLRDARVELFYVCQTHDNEDDGELPPTLTYILCFMGRRAHAQNDCARAKDLLVRRATCGLLEGPGR